MEPLPKEGIDTLVLLGQRLRAELDVMIGAMENGDYALGLVAAGHLAEKFASHLMPIEFRVISEETGLAPKILMKALVQTRGAEAVLDMIQNLDEIVNRYNAALSQAGRRFLEGEG